MSSRESVTHTIVCVECQARSSSATERGWRGYRSDDEPAESSGLVFYCPACAAAEFGAASPPKRRPKPDVDRSQRHWDRRRAAALTYRVTIAAVVAMKTTDDELAAAFDALTSAGATNLAVPPTGDGANRRVEFDLEAQNVGHATRLATALVETLTEATPSIADGWTLASIDPR